MTDSYTALHPQAAELLRTIEAKNAAPWNAVPLDQARRTYVASCQQAMGPEIEIFGTESLAIDGDMGGIPARLYRPSKGQKLPVIVYYHGGGFVLGDLDSHDNLCRRLCLNTGALVVSVDYRLAPEHPFPAATDDALQAALWAQKNIESLGGDPHKIILCGDSAGATLATVTAIQLRDQNRPAPLGQVLMYPVIDPKMNMASYEKRKSGYRLTKELMAWYFELYLSNPESRQHKHAALLTNDNLSDLPPTLVVTAGFDPLCDEGEAYAIRLQKSGTSTTHEHYPAMIHGFCGMFEVLDEGDQALDKIADWVLKLLNPCTGQSVV